MLVPYSIDEASLRADEEIELTSEATDDKEAETVEAYELREAESVVLDSCAVAIAAHTSKVRSFISIRNVRNVS